MYIYNIVSDEIMIFETPQRSNVSSNLLRGDDTIHKQRQKTTSFLDAHTTFKLHWPLTRPISKANIASFTGPLPGQSQKPILPASLAPCQANLKSQYCQLHWPLTRPISKANIAKFIWLFIPGPSSPPIESYLSGRAIHSWGLERLVPTIRRFASSL